MKKVLLFVAAVVVVLVVAVSVYLNWFLPAARPASTLAIELTPELLARGEYLTEHVVVCMACHGSRDWERYGAPALDIVEGDCWDERIGFPGRVCAPNLTPHAATGMGEWTDGEILRALREGVDRDGVGLFPIMPYPEYRSLSDADAAAVVAYLRTLPARDAAVPERQLPGMLFMAAKMAPAPLDGPVAAPDPSDTVAYGGYLTRVAACYFCHTPVDGQGVNLDDRAWSGGHEFPLPSGRVVRSSNLTPAQTGIGGLSRDNFIALFRAFEDVEAVAVHDPEGRNTVMPWYWYSGMTDADLGAIYDYLRTVAPIDNVIEHWPPAAD